MTTPETLLRQVWKELAGYARTNLTKELFESVDSFLDECGKHEVLVGTDWGGATPSAAPLDAQIDRLDLMNDEFKRIKALTDNSEIQGLCDRAMSNIKQHTPVIKQRDDAIAERDTQSARIRELEAKVEEARVLGLQQAIDAIKILQMEYAKHQSYRVLEKAIKIIENHKKLNHETDVPPTTTQKG